MGLEETVRIVLDGKETAKFKAIEKKLKNSNNFMPDKSKFAEREKLETQSSKRVMAITKDRQNLLRQLETKGLNPKGGMAGMNVKDLDKLNHRMNVLGKRTRTFKMHWLGIMFAGMALQRMFGKLFKTLIEDYKELTKESLTPLGESLISLEANWKFLKFAMVDAASPLIMKITDMLSSMAVTLAKADPEILTKIFKSIASLAGVGGVAGVLGQGALMFGSIAGASATYNLDSLVKTVDSTGKMDVAKLKGGTNFFDALTKAAGIAAIGFSIKNIIEGLDKISDGDWLGTLYDTFSAVAFAGAAHSLMKPSANLKAAGVWAAIGISFELLENNKLGKTFSSILGVVVGFFSGITAAISVGIAKLQLGINEAVDGKPLLQILFGNKQSAIEKYTAQNYTMGEAFTKGFQDSFTDVYAVGIKFDNFMDELRENAKQDIENPIKSASEDIDDAAFWLTVAGNSKNKELNFNFVWQQAWESYKKTMFTDKYGENKELWNSVSGIMYNSFQNEFDNLYKKELPKNVITFINDEEGDIKAMINGAIAYNDEIGKPIEKTVNETRNVTYNYTNDEINPVTGG